MTTDEQYVPDEGQVRAWCREGVGDYPDVMDEWLDRFLARVRRDAAREALDGYAKWEEKRFHHLHVNGESAEASKCAYAALTARAYLHLRYHEESP